MSLAPNLTPSLAPTLTTARLTLRGAQAGDFDAFAQVLGSDHAVFMDGPLSRGRAWAWFCTSAAGWALSGIGGVMIEAEGKVVGQISVGQGPHFPETELGWLVYPGATGRGYASEAARAFRGWAYANTDLRGFVSYIAPGNAASRALAEKLGAVEDPTARRPQGEGPEDCMVYRHPRPEAEI